MIEDNSEGLTIAFIGCGNMGSAVLIGLLDVLYPDGATTPTSDKFKNFVAVTRSKAGADNLNEILGHHKPRVNVSYGIDANVDAMSLADVVVLGFKPYHMQPELSQNSVKQALKGKLVISMLAGITVSDIRSTLIGPYSESADDYFVGKAHPSIAARHRESMTILEASEPPLPLAYAALQEWIFNQVGSTHYLAPDLVSTGGMLVTNCAASLSIAYEGLLDGAVAGGLRRSDASALAVQGVKGWAAILESGVHPAVMREEISSPRGMTIQSLVTLEKGAVRGVFAQAQINGTDHVKPKDK